MSQSSEELTKKRVASYKKIFEVVSSKIAPWFVVPPALLFSFYLSSLIFSSALLVGIFDVIFLLISSMIACLAIGGLCVLAKFTFDKIYDLFSQPKPDNASENNLQSSYIKTGQELSSLSDIHTLSTINSNSEHPENAESDSNWLSKAMQFLGKSFSSVFTQPKKNVTPPIHHFKI